MLVSDWFTDLCKLYKKHDGAETIEIYAEINASSEFDAKN